MTAKIKRNYPIGAELFLDGVHFRVWAPDHKNVDLVLENVEKEPIFHRMKKERNGYFSFFSKRAKEGTYYRYKLSSQWCPDPASRYQPHGTLGPSCLSSLP